MGRTVATFGLENTLRNPGRPKKEKKRFLTRSPLFDGHTANVTEDMLIRKADVDRGVLTATSIFEAQEQPSVVLS